MSSGSTDPQVASLLNTIPEDFMIDDESHFQGRSILRIFLWTIWQRTIMLYFYFIVGVQIHQGFSTEWSKLLAIQGSSRLTDLNSEDVRPEGVDYMCNWAFELL